MPYVFLKSLVPCLLLLVAACSAGPGTTVVMREDIDGSPGFLSRAETLPGSARFECLASASGQCHYAVFAGACGPLAQAVAGTWFACDETAAPTLRFDLAVGEAREVDGLPLDFRHCVRERPGAITASCLQALPAAVATRDAMAGPTG